MEIDEQDFSLRADVLKLFRGKDRPTVDRVLKSGDSKIYGYKNFENHYKIWVDVGLPKDFLKFDTGGISCAQVDRKKTKQLSGIDYQIEPISVRQLALHTRSLLEKVFKSVVRGRNPYYNLIKHFPVKEVSSIM